MSVLEEAAMQKFAPVVLRLGLILLFFWFGFSQVASPEQWVSWVPGWVPAFTHMDARVIVLLNGGFEIVGGTFLLLGLFVRSAALVLGLHLLVIAYEIGYNDIGVRDFVLAICCFSLALFGARDWSIMTWFSRRSETSG